MSRYSGNASFIIALEAAVGELQLASVIARLSRLVGLCPCMFPWRILPCTFPPGEFQRCGDNDGHNNTNKHASGAWRTSDKFWQNFIHPYIAIIRVYPPTSSWTRRDVSCPLLMVICIFWKRFLGRYWRARTHIQFRLSCKHRVGRCSLEFCESNTRQSAFHKDNASVSRWWQCNFIEAKLLSLLSTKLIAWKLVRAILCACASFQLRNT